MHPWCGSALLKRRAGANGDAARLYLPGEIVKDEFIARVLETTDNPRIIAALAAHGHPVSRVD